ncbi:NAD(P)-dependent oxidoreductase [Pseudactinotalea sp. Z1748]|uniref:NAD(P)-dependent oxidoreductase n=1 Tax=Pseudactinotalea sp. Z1748 TaxID=3413027 RepID=UPI003C79C3A7
MSGRETTTDAQESSREQDSTCAVIGLGQMGSGMARAQRLAGRTVYGVDPVVEVTIEGVVRADLTEALTQADVVLLSLPGSEQVRHVLTGPGGLVDLDLPAKLIVDTSTSDPASTRELAQTLSRHDHVLVDAPVSGGPAGARNQTLTVFLGCPEAELERVQRVLAPMATTITRVGEVGAGNIAKLANNLLCAIHLTAAREAWAMARAAGVDAERLLTAINGASGRSAVTEVNMPRWVLSGSYDSGFPVKLMARDVALADQVARQMGVDNPLSGTAVSAWQDLLTTAGPEADFNRMVDL